MEKRLVSFGLIAACVLLFGPNAGAVAINDKRLADVTFEDVEKVSRDIMMMCGTRFARQPDMVHTCWKASTGFSYRELTCAHQLVISMPQEAFDKTGWKTELAIMGAVVGDTCSPRTR